MNMGNKLRMINMDKTYILDKVEAGKLNNIKQQIIDDISVKLKSNISERRYKHSINVMNCSIELAAHHGADIWEAALVGLLHDCARDIRDEEAIKLCDRYGIEVDQVSAIQPDLLHGKLAAFLAVELYLKDFSDGDGSQKLLINQQSLASILNAIRYHTTGHPGMSLLDSIIFIADFIEPERSFPSVDIIRKAAFEDLDKAVLMGMDSTVNYVLGKGRLLHPDTIYTRNWVIMKMHGQV